MADLPPPPRRLVTGVALLLVATLAGGIATAVKRTADENDKVTALPSDTPLATESPTPEPVPSPTEVPEPLESVAPTAAPPPEAQPSPAATDAPAPVEPAPAMPRTGSDPLLVLAGLSIGAAALGARRLARH